jgi:hypothetical protein
MTRMKRATIFLSCRTISPSKRLGATRRGVKKRLPWSHVVGVTVNVRSTLGPPVEREETLTDHRV